MISDFMCVSGVQELDSLMYEHLSILFQSLVPVWVITVCSVNLPGSSAHEIFQARVLEWGAMAVST